ncbi:hypothetical protein WMY93_019748 [Mugilogobius chulae]|uniref:Uncharacterized protein n=1 Tax=Mugilogobius chulae TaxID=88201 RepID=A0AAW0NK43_9GOBI
MASVATGQRGTSRASRNLEDTNYSRSGGLHVRLYSSQKPLCCRKVLSKSTLGMGPRTFSWSNLCYFWDFPFKRHLFTPGE